MGKKKKNRKSECEKRRGWEREREMKECKKKRGGRGEEEGERQTFLIQIPLLKTGGR